MPCAINRRSNAICQQSKLSVIIFFVFTLVFCHKADMSSGFLFVRTSHKSKRAQCVCVLAFKIRGIRKNNGEGVDL